MINKELIWSAGAASGVCEVLERPRGDTPHPRSGAVALRRYLISKVRSGACTLLDQPCGDTPRPKSEKPQ